MKKIINTVMMITACMPLHAVIPITFERVDQPLQEDQKPRAYLIERIYECAVQEEGKTVTKEERDWYLLHPDLKSITIDFNKDDIAEISVYLRGNNKSDIYVKRLLGRKHIIERKHERTIVMCSREGFRTHLVPE